MSRAPGRRRGSATMRWVVPAILIGLALLLVLVVLATLLSLVVR